jgi:MFS transporter, CP family, cyanate transporter
MMLSTVTLTGMRFGNAAGVAFSIYAFMTAPMAIITPLIGHRLKNPMVLAVLLAAAGPLSYLEDKFV